MDTLWDNNFVQNKADIVENVHTFHGYAIINSKAKRKFHRKKIRQSTNFVALRDGNEWKFAPSKFVGYRKNKKATHENRTKKPSRHGGMTTNVIKKLFNDQDVKRRDRGYAKIEKEFLAYYQKLHGDELSNNRSRLFWIMNIANAQEENLSTTELGEESILYEGTSMTVLVNKYERSREARDKCIEHHGLLCCVCGFDFGAVYGELGKGFIHVHHRRSLSNLSTKRPHIVDPVKDLVPVCPNCHCMLHRGVDITIGELKKIMRNTEEV